MTLALRIQLEGSTSLKEGEKTITNPDNQVELLESSLVPVDEALTGMVAQEELKVDEPGPINVHRNVPLLFRQQ